MVDVFIDLSVLDVATLIAEDSPDVDLNVEDDVDISGVVGVMVVVDCNEEVELACEVESKGVVVEET